MNPNLKWKALFILAVIIACIYGLIGVPSFPTSPATIKDNFAHQIKLGLDLQGGTHLILQVQVQEAIAQETDQTVDRLISQMRAKNIRYDEVRRVDDTHILKMYEITNPQPAPVTMKDGYSFTTTATSFTDTRARGLAFFKSWMSCAKSSIE